MSKLACRFSDFLAKACANVWMAPGSIAVCVIAWLVRPPTDPFNSLVSDISVVLLFVLARSGDRDTRKIIAGTEELVRAVPEAREAVLELGDKDVLR